jgi:hypothetical protein
MLSELVYFVIMLVTKQLLVLVYFKPKEQPFELVIKQA